MTSLLATLLSQQALSGNPLPFIPTRKALLLLNLQNDFLLAQDEGGKLSVGELGFLDRIADLVPKFRAAGGEVIWMRTSGSLQIAADGIHEDDDDETVIVNEKRRLRPIEAASGLSGKGRAVAAAAARKAGKRDKKPSKSAPSFGKTNLPLPPSNVPPRTAEPELFLSPTTPLHLRCCLPDTPGILAPDSVIALQSFPKDLHMTKSHYSAFQSTSLLLALRSKLVTELFVAGCHTNLCVYATARDAAMYGIRVSLVEDCLGCRTKSRGERAMKDMRDVLEAGVMSAEEVIESVNSKDDVAHESKTRSTQKSKSKDDEVILSSDEEIHKTTRPGSGDGIEEAPQRRIITPTSKFVPPMDPAAEVKMEQAELEIDSAEESEQEPELPGNFLDKFKAGQRKFVRGAPIPMPSYRSSRVGGHRHEPASRASLVDLSHGEDSDQVSTGHQSSINRQHGAIVKHETSIQSSSRSTAPAPMPQDLVTATRSMSQGPLAPTNQSRPSSSSSAKPGTVPIETSCVPSDSTSIDGLVEALSTTAIETAVQENTPIFGPGTDVQSAGSKLVHPFLPSSFAVDVFSQLNAEIVWQKMYHRDGEVPRLVCCQAKVGSGDEVGGDLEKESMPVYRHPADHLPPTGRFTPTVDRIRREAERHVGHPLNHVLIQLYRSGRDNISEHSDKTLDIVAESFIVNVSLGAQRTMRLRTKRDAATTDSSVPGGAGSNLPPRQPATSSKSRRRAKSSVSTSLQTSASRETHRIVLPHNSLLALSLQTNAKYLHAIKADKRLAAERNPAELAFDGQRISLTFRYIGTWISADQKWIWGTGARGKTRQDARLVDGDEGEMSKMLDAFGKENASEGLAWDEGIYGEGYDVLHLMTENMSREA